MGMAGWGLTERQTTVKQVQERAFMAELCPGELFVY